jgi:exonuclease III
LDRGPLALRLAWRDSLRVRWYGEDSGSPGAAEKVVDAMERIRKPTPAQYKVLDALRQPGAYLSYESYHWWQIVNVYKRSHGVKLDYIVGAKTVECLKTAGRIKHDKRIYFGKQQVGFFLA